MTRARKRTQIAARTPLPRKFNRGKMPLPRKFNRGKMPLPRKLRGKCRSHEG